MIILDTNVLSELMRARPAPQVLEWVNRQPARSLFTTSVTQAELLLGVALLPDGKKKLRLLEAMEHLFRQDFRGLVLPFDSDAAEAFAAIAGTQQRSGRTMAQFDAQIVAIAHSRGGKVATRNVRDFEGCGVEIIDPWTEDAAW